MAPFALLCAPDRRKCLSLVKAPVLSFVEYQWIAGAMHRMGHATYNDHMVASIVGDLKITFECRQGIANDWNAALALVCGAFRYR